MKKISKIAAILFSFAFAAHAQLKGIGYDTDLSQITARLAIGPNFLDLGAGLKISGSKDENGAPVTSDGKFQMSASGFFLGHLHDFGPVDTYFTAGGIFAKTKAANDNIQLRAFAGFQPEVTMLDHIVISTRFGLDIPLIPNFVFQTAGNGISIVNGANFKILF